jgi:chorismate lyase / 3-hydroxybenzoate synthase
VLALLTRLSSGHLPDAGAAECVLGGACLGQLDDVEPAWPEQRIFAPVAGSTATGLHEVWRSAAPCTAGSSEGITWRRADDILYGVIDLDEAAFCEARDCSPLQAASQEAYARIFRLLAVQGLPHLWRAWNYFADINGESHGLERYRQFNIGRQDAFLEFSRGATGNVPAACAIGLAGGPLSIAFMAGAQPATAIENPRQISAYDYPADYGPRSPTFSRAVLVAPLGQEVFFVSGTASIVGHRTVHVGDVAAQCREVLANIAAVVEAANRQCRSAAFSLGELSYRVYVRRAEDFKRVKDALAAELVGATDIVFVQADICRTDLLLEIEATAIHTLTG